MMKDAALVSQPAFEGAEFNTVKVAMEQLCTFQGIHFMNSYFGNQDLRKCSLAALTKTEAKAALLMPIASARLKAVGGAWNDIAV